MLKWTDLQNVRYMLEGGLGICTFFQAASAAAARGKASGKADTISLDIETCTAKEIEADLRVHQRSSGSAREPHGKARIELGGSLSRFDFWLPSSCPGSCIANPFYFCLFICIIRGLRIPVRTLSDPRPLPSSTRTLCIVTIESSNFVVSGQHMRDIHFK
jgi:hypothetical protein